MSSVSVPEAPPAQATEAPPAPETPPVRHRQPARQNLRRQEVFITAYTTPDAPTWLNGTRSALAAGYTPRFASQQATRLLKMKRIKEKVEARIREVETPMQEVLPAEAGIPWVQRQHLEAMLRCRNALDRTNEREHLVMYGKTIGAYDTTLHLDVVVQHQYDERLAQEATRLARLALEEMGDRELGLLPAPDQISAGSAPVLEGSSSPDPVPAPVLGQLVQRSDGPGADPAQGMDSAEPEPEPEHDLDSSSAGPAPAPEPAQGPDSATAPSQEPAEASMLSDRTPKPPDPPGPRCE